MIKKTKLKEAVKLLETHNKWRRGDISIDYDTKKLGIAIDLIVEAMNEYLSNDTVILKKKLK